MIVDGCVFNCPVSIIFLTEKNFLISDFDVAKIIAMDAAFGGNFYNIFIYTY